MNQQQIEQYLGPRGEHYHGGNGDAGCFSVCPVWDWDLRARKLQAHILDGKIALLEEVHRRDCDVHGMWLHNQIDAARAQRAKIQL